MTQDTIAKLVALGVFIVMCIVTFIFGNLEKKNLTAKQDLHKKGNTPINKETLKVLLKPSLYPFVFMVIVPLLLILMTSCFFIYNIAFDKESIIILVVTLVVGELGFLIIHLINYRHIFIMNKKGFEVNVIKLKEKAIKKDLHYLIVDENKKIRISKFDYDLATDKDCYLVTINKKELYLPKSKFEVEEV